VLGNRLFKDNIMKLEIKHLLPYLPYELRIERISYKRERFKILSGYDFCPDGEIENIKPILKPISYLTKDENFDLYMDLCEEIGVVRCEHLLLALQDNLKYAFNLQQLNALEEFMNKNHFDWKFNLIENGLATSIYDVEQAVS